MNKIIQEPEIDGASVKRHKRDYAFIASILISIFVFGFVIISKSEQVPTSKTISVEQSSVQSVEIPIAWGDMGKKMVAVGVIDKNKFLSIYADRGGLGTEEQKLLDGTGNGRIHVNAENANLLLNLFWAFGLGNKNQILDHGEMMNPAYGGAGRFASTGGWTLARGNPMDHYGMHDFVVLANDQQSLVDRVSRNIYRPCCGNSTHFPDCNHGMAMLGMLELMVSQGATESEMYKTALVMNSFWFPDQYQIVAKYLASQGRNPESVDPKEVLDVAYSSSAGYQRIMSLVPPDPRDHNGGGGCGV